MKNIFTALFMLSFTLMFSQDVVEEKQNKYGFEVTAKFGSSKLDLKDAVDLNGSFSAGDFLFVYRLNEKSTLKSGVTLAEFNSNFTSLGITLVAPLAITLPKESTEGKRGSALRLTICCKATMICEVINTGSIF